MTTIRRVAIFGASGNFGAPITTALIKSGFDVTIISRPESTSTFPDGIPVIKAAYTTNDLTRALYSQEAVVCVVGPPGIHHQTAMIDAAEAAGVKRFIINDYGWGPDSHGLPEFDEIHAKRREQWNHAKGKAEANSAFTWTGITTGNPIDWALKKFPAMGFDFANSSAIVYDQGEESFTGTTLEGIGQSVVGVLRHPSETANRFVKVLSIKTCQKELLQAFETVSKKQWEVQYSTTKALLERGRSKLRNGSGGWILDVVVAQLYDEGEARCCVATSREETDSDLLGVVAETPELVVSKALGLRAMF